MYSRVDGGPCSHACQWQCSLTLCSARQCSQSHTAQHPRLKHALRENLFSIALLLRVFRFITSGTVAGVCDGCKNTHAQGWTPAVQVASLPFKLHA